MYTRSPHVVMRMVKEGKKGPKITVIELHLLVYFMVVKFQSV